MKQSLKMENKKVVLIEKSTELFLTYGIQHVSMDDIADKCGISKKTIYKFFENKNDLLLQIITIKIKKLKQILKIYPKKHSNSVKVLYTFFEDIKLIMNKISPILFIEIKKHYPNIFIEILKIKTYTLLPFISENIKQGKEEKLYKNNLKATDLCKSYDTMFNMIFMNYYNNSKSEQQTSISFLNNLFLHRLVSTKGLEELNKLYHKN
tara:strand:+ start:59 stop:682 length:624 start_codon:yes stop_codon:yes gene_type:complete